ncbi:Class I glutamine amidotransferase-like protein [Abortiporus biennis]
MEHNNTNRRPRILFIFTSANKTLQGNQTGWYLPEAAHPYYVLEPHADIEFASPKGPNPPIHERSILNFKDDEICVKFLKDPIVKSKFSKAKKLTEIMINSSNDDFGYDVLFYPGGHGPVMDLASDPLNAKIASEFFRAGKIVAAICHGPAALVGATDLEGKSIFEGRSATGYSNEEEGLAKASLWVPFLVEDRLKSLGATYVKAEELWKPKVVASGNLITGQNPASSKPIGEEILRALTA